MTIHGFGRPGRWRAGGTELAIEGWENPDLVEAVQKAIMGYIVPLTINGVPVAWITPPEPQPLPPLMRAIVRSRLGMRPAAERIAERGDSDG